MLHSCQEPCFCRFECLAVEFSRERERDFVWFASFPFDECFRVASLPILGPLCVLWWTLPFGFLHCFCLIVNSWF